jgi:hypothetical protein
MAMRKSILIFIGLYSVCDVSKAWQSENFLGFCRPRQGYQEQGDIHGCWSFGRWPAVAVICLTLIRSKPMLTSPSDMSSAGVVRGRGSLCALVILSKKWNRQGYCFLGMIWLLKILPWFLSLFWSRFWCFGTQSCLFPRLSVAFGTVRLFADVSTTGGGLSVFPGIASVPEVSVSISVDLTGAKKFRVTTSLGGYLRRQTFWPVQLVSLKFVFLHRCCAASAYELYWTLRPGLFVPLRLSVI